ncbi:MAG: lamin tail domain-containing protein [Bacteroides sp.]|nr:lamin tail domain-containing protein [Bacteroides sp.]
MSKLFWILTIGKVDMKTLLKSLAALYLILLLNVTAWPQTSTVVIAEVMYDHPVHENENTLPAHTGEFMSLYNYGEEDVDISGWRIEITDLLVSPQKQYSYTIPSKTILQESSVAIIASRPSNSSFDVLNFYEAEIPEETDEHILLYTPNLAFPDTRSQIRIYDAKKNLQDELVYDGNSNALPNEPLLRAQNALDAQRPMKETASIQRKTITINEGKHIISRINYFLTQPETVKLFAFVIDEFSYLTNTSVLAEPPLVLSGTANGNQGYIAPNIESSQAIKSGKVSYIAEGSIVLEPGFEVQSGAEFHATIEPDSFHHIKIMTYNLKGKHTDYGKHAEVVKGSNADIVAIQEVKGNKTFKKLKNESGYNGNRCFTIGVAHYGIGILWNSKTIGFPIAKSYHTIWTWSLFNDKEKDLRRAYMVAEFKDFCFVSTHYSLDQYYRKRMTECILNDQLVQKCMNAGKPVYIAGDLNADHTDPEIENLKNAGFVVLNNTEREKDENGKETDRYEEPTGEKGGIPDLILEYNVNPNHKTIERGIYSPEKWKKTWFQEISDHRTYRVKVKIK